MTTPIAIIGMSARVPGAQNLREFWDLLLAGRDAITEVPADRWRLEDYHADKFGTPGKTHVRHGGFIANLFDFDHALFGISAREAQRIDPQQLLALELAFSALEDAGLGKPAIAGAAGGVFMGATTSDARYAYMGRLDKLDGFSSTGLSPGVIANRISYFFDLRGPSLVLDTGCSASLVGLHLAVESLRRRETSIAFAGGVNVLLSPEQHIAMSQVNMLAADGRCRSFDAAGEGMVRSEGGGVVLLKRLDDAVRDGDRVRAVILGAAVNQDGRTQGLTHPNRAAQVAVMQAALADAGVRASDVSVIEAHGTGTRTGDPVELSALSQVYSGVRIGSVKSNIGHLEGAAGVAGLIKLVLQLEQRTLVPSIHFKTPNPRASWEGLAVQTAVEPWAGDRVGALSAFSFGGTNAHVIVASALPASARAAVPAPFVLPLSARDSAALAELKREQPVTAEHAAAAAYGTHAFEYRAAVTPARVREKRALRAARVGFVFTGHGPKWAGIGLDLAARFAVFRQSLERSARGLPFDLFAALRAASVETTEVLQPLITAVQMACVELLASCGVEPAIVFGHSIGEVAAAFCAGVFDREAALAFAVARGRSLESLRGRGGMIALPPGVALPAGISLAAENDETQCVVSGDTQAILVFERECGVRGVVTQRLELQYPFHSALVASVAFPSVASGTAIRPIIACADGALRTSFDVDYWRRQAREPVQFLQARKILEQHADVVIELGPKSLSRLLERRWQAEGPQVASALTELEFFDAIGAAWTTGVPVTWSALYPRVHTARPSYPFQRKRVWHFAPPSPAVPDTFEATALPLHRWSWQPIELLDAPKVSGTSVTLASAKHASLGGKVLLWRQVNEASLRKLLATADSVVVADVSSGFSEAHLLAAGRLFAQLARVLPKSKVRVSLLTTAAHEEQQAFTVGLFRVLMNARRANAGLWLDAVDPLSAKLRERFARWQLNPPATRQLQWKNKKLHTAKLEPETLTSAFVANKNASYVITGGLGGVGKCLALALAQAGARRIVLLSRRPLPAREQWARAGKRDRKDITELLAIEALGATIEVRRCDVSRRSDVRAFFASERDARRPPIVTVFHLAGTVETCFLEKITPAAIRLVTQGKLGGARHLHEHSKAKIVVVSGFAATVGIPSLAAYSAANAALEAFALRTGHSVVVSGTISDVGMAKRGGAFTEFGDHGMTAQALAAVLLAAQASDHKLFAVRADWAAMKNVAPHLGALLEDLAPHIAAASSADEGRVELVRKAAAQLLMVDDLGPDDDFFSRGATSLSLMLFITKLKRQGFHATPDMIFTHPSARALAAHITQTSDAESMASIGVLKEQTRRPLSEGLLASRIATVIKVAALRDVNPSVLGAAIEKWASLHQRLRLRVLRVGPVWLQGLADDPGVTIVRQSTLDLSAAAIRDRLWELIVTNAGDVVISLSPWLGDERYLRVLAASFAAVLTQKKSAPTELGALIDVRPKVGPERKPTFTLVKKTKRKR